MRWFAVGKYQDSYRLICVFSHDGRQLYYRENSQPVEWWVFVEVKRGEEIHGGPLQHGSTCGLFYPDGEEHAMACIYSLRPWRDYPRFHTAMLDDLPEVVRSGCKVQKDKRGGEGVLLFPPYDRLPADCQPIYAALAVTAEGKYDPKALVIHSIAKKAELEMSKQEEKK